MWVINTKQLHEAATHTAAEIMERSPEKDQALAFWEALAFELGCAEGHRHGGGEFDQRFTEAANEYADELKRIWGEVISITDLEYLAWAVSVEFSLCQAFPERHRAA